MKWMKRITVLSIALIILTFTMLPELPSVLEQQLSRWISDIRYANIESNETEKANLQVYFIDVGQADAALLISDGHAMLIDGGTSGDSQLIFGFLKSHGIKHLDAIVCTHPHVDHVGGLAGALNYATADKAYCSIDTYDSKAFHSFQKYLKQQNVSLTIPKAGDSWQLGGATVKLLGPTNFYEEMNDNSLILRVAYGKTSFLFMGDAEKTAEEDLINSRAILKSDVLKVGHHGSSDSSTEALLKKVRPSYAVISVGEDNDYGHPATAALKRLEKTGATIFRTDINGTVLCESNGVHLTFTTEK